MVCIVYNDITEGLAQLTRVENRTIGANTFMSFIGIGYTAQASPYATRHGVFERYLAQNMLFFNQEQRMTRRMRLLAKQQRTR